MLRNKMQKEQTRPEKKMKPQQAPNQVHSEHRLIYGEVRIGPLDHT